MLSQVEKNSSYCFNRSIGQISELITDPNKIRFSDYDFLDFGCSRGKSIERSLKAFSAKRGLGIDKNPRKIAEAIANGYEAIVCDVSKLKVQKNAVRFVTMKHFLEHLSDFKTVQKCIENAAVFAQDFLYISQPYFDADGYLFLNKLKFYWSDWTGHPNRMTTLELFSILNHLAKTETISRFAIYGRSPVKYSSDSTIHPFNSLKDQHHYDPNIHPPKKIMKFKNHLYKETVALVTISDSGMLPQLERKVNLDKKLFDSLD